MYKLLPTENTIRNFENPLFGGGGFLEQETRSYDLDLAYTPRILLVDDDPDQLLLIATYLRRLDYEVRTANDARDALEKIRCTVVDVLVSDVMMPEMCGIQLIEAVREMPAYSRLPSILMTAASTHLEWDSIASGADMFCDKKKARYFLNDAIRYLLSY